MTLTVSEIAALVSSAASAAALLIAIWAKLTARSKQDIAELRTLQTTASERLTRLEAAIDLMPRAEMVHELRVQLATMEGRLNVVSEQLKPIGLVSSRLQDWLLENHK